MVRKLVLTSVFALMLSPLALASDYGSAEEASALLDRAVVLLKAEGRAAIPKLDSDSFRDRDLYVFCANVSDGVSVVHSTDKGTRILDYDFGKEIMRKATESEVKEVTYEMASPRRELRRSRREVLLLHQGRRSDLWHRLL